ncbi:MAG: hypothetical protein KBF99_05720 [Leptospiraceae bacterium]|nr:hypothetical protein [Leptospiraceae bacterium]
MEAWSINCILLYASLYAANRNLLTVADSLMAHYVEYLLLMRLMLLIHLIRRNAQSLSGDTYLETYNQSSNYYAGMSDYNETKNAIGQNFTPFSS